MVMTERRDQLANEAVIIRQTADAVRLTRHLLLQFRKLIAINHAIIVLIVANGLADFPHFPAKLMTLSIAKTATHIRSLDARAQPIHPSLNTIKRIIARRDIREPYKSARYKSASCRSVRYSLAPYSLVRCKTYQTRSLALYRSPARHSSASYSLALHRSKPCNLVQYSLASHTSPPKKYRTWSVPYKTWSTRVGYNLSSQDGAVTVDDWCE